ncbi:MAG: oligosaccharide flippase family protein, partial [Gemmiger sp.]|nr:oligosaccharide flippase family protein [Gemmiger sp.]
MRGKTYLKNAVLLTATGFVLRALGMVFRVYIAGAIGSEGMGLYQLILSLYMVFVAVATSGIQVASTQLAARNLARGQALGRTARGIVTVAALLGTAAMLGQSLLAGPAARFLLHDVRAEFSLRVLAPSLPFMAVSGALRGCFLAKRRVQPNVTAQLVEQMVRMVVAGLILGRVQHWGAGYACAAVLAGNTISEVVSCLIMLGYAGREKAFLAPPGTPRPYTRRELWGVLLPVEGSRMLASALQAAESSLIPLCLAIYTGQRTEAMSQYGALKGMAIPLLFFPFTVLAALSGLLMPEITRAHTCKDTAGTARLIDTVMTATGLFSALAGVLFLLFGKQAATLLYGDSRVGLYVQVLGVAAPFMYTESMVDGVLKGLGEQWATFRYSVVDSAVRIAGILALLPRFGMQGFLCVMVASNLLTCTLNTARMLRCTGTHAHWWRWALRPLLLAGLGGGAGLGVLAAMPGGGVGRLVAACMVVCGVYLA